MKALTVPHHLPACCSRRMRMVLQGQWCNCHCLGLQRSCQAVHNTKTLTSCTSQKLTLKLMFLPLWCSWTFGFNFATDLKIFISEFPVVLVSINCIFCWHTLTYFCLLDMCFLPCYFDHTTLYFYWIWEWLNIEYLKYLVNSSINVYGCTDIAYA